MCSYHFTSFIISRVITSIEREPREISGGSKTQAKFSHNVYCSELGGDSEVSSQSSVMVSGCDHPFFEWPSWLERWLAGLGIWSLV